MAHTLMHVKPCPTKEVLRAVEILPLPRIIKDINMNMNILTFATIVREMY